MICPKCQSQLRTVDRQGVHLEQCQNCQGVFLDHGELEQILAAEQRFYGGAAPYVPPGEHHSYPDSPPHYGHHPSPPGFYGHHKRRRRSFLEELLG